MTGLRAAVLAWLLLAAASPADAAPAARNGREIYRSFREGLAGPVCVADHARWRRQYAAAPKRLAARHEDVLPLFAHVVDVVRAARLPTEYALIPFVESGYRPQARSETGPAGLWQIIAPTARRLQVPLGKHFDGRFSPVESTRAAVRYLATLHRLFGGNWRLAAMAYNGGEQRVLRALRRSGRAAHEAEPGQLDGLPATTRSYADKLSAIACLIDAAGDREDWLRALDRPVPPLAPETASGVPAKRLR